MWLRSTFLVCFAAIVLNVVSATAQEISVEIVDANTANLVIAGFPSPIEFPMTAEELQVVEEAFRSYYKVHAHNREKLLSALTFIVSIEANQGDLGQLVADVEIPLTGMHELQEQLGLGDPIVPTGDEGFLIVDPFSTEEDDQRIQKAGRELNWTNINWLRRMLVTTIVQEHIQTPASMGVLWATYQYSHRGTQERFLLAILIREWLQKDRNEGKRTYTKSCRPFDFISHIQPMDLRGELVLAKDIVAAAWVFDAISDDVGRAFVEKDEPLTIEEIKKVVDFVVAHSPGGERKVEQFTTTFIESYLHSEISPTGQRFKPTFDRVLFAETTPEDARALLIQLGRFNARKVSPTLWNGVVSPSIKVREGALAGLTLSPRWGSTEIPVSPYIEALEHQSEKSVILAALEATFQTKYDRPGKEIILWLNETKRFSRVEKADLLREVLEKAAKAEDERILGYLDALSVVDFGSYLSISEGAVRGVLTILFNDALFVAPETRDGMIQAILFAGTVEDVHPEVVLLISESATPFIQEGWIEPRSAMESVETMLDRAAGRHPEALREVAQAYKVTKSRVVGWLDGQVNKGLSQEQIRKAVIRGKGRAKR